MKTIMIPEPGKVMMTETEMPEVKQGEALLKILYGGICGSDLGTYREHLRMQAIRGFRGMNFPHRS